MYKYAAKAKKRVALFTAILIVAGALGGCGGTPTPPPPTTTPSTAAPPATTPPATTPPPTTTAPAAPAAGGEKLVVALQTNSFITKYDSPDNYLTKYMEEKLGAKIELYLLPAETTEVRTKISLMVSAKDSMPDVVIVDNCLTPETILDYGSKGAFIPLNSYLNDPAKAPNFTAIPEEDKKVIWDSLTGADGNVYALPKYEPETWNLTPNRMFINGAWLKKLNLQVPTTTDELYNVLVSFRDNDPNGNGIKDEMGVYGYAEGGYGQNTIWALMNSFAFYNGAGQNNGLALDEAGTKVVAPFTTEGWKKGLTYLNKLCNEKLLAPAIFTDDDTQFKATLNNGAGNIVGLVSAGSTGNWPDVDNNASFQEMDIIAPLKGPDGIAYTPYNPYSPNQEFFITSNCKNPDLAFKLGDLFLAQEASIISRFGEKGVDWSEEPDMLTKTTNAFVVAGIYDKLNLVYMTNIWAENASKHWHNISPRYASLERGNTVGNLYRPYDPSLKSAMLNSFSYEHYYPAHPEKMLTILHYTADEASQIAEPITNISEYVKQSVAEFVTGARNIEKDWDGYIKELEKMGLQTWLTSAQAAYDRSGK